MKISLYDDEASKKWKLQEKKTKTLLYAAVDAASVSVRVRNIYSIWRFYSVQL
jgi:hypothetical protein